MLNHFLGITGNLILHICVADFQRLTLAYKFWLFIRVDLISMNLPKVMYNTIEINNTGQQQICSLRFFNWFRTNLMCWIQKSHLFCSIRSSFWAMATCHFLCFCSHVWSILEEIGGGKMPCQIIVLIGNDYFNDKKYSVPIVLGDYFENGSVWSHKTMFSVLVWQ